MGEMTPEFAIQILRGVKVAPIPNIPGNPVLYGYQDQKFYDIARNMAIQAIQENAALKEQISALERRLEACGAEKAAGKDGGTGKGR